MNHPAVPAARREKIEQAVAALVSRMTLEEKAGQMTQLALDGVSQGADGRLEPHALDPKKLRTALVEHHVGSLLGIGNHGYSVEHWHEIIRGIQDVALQETRLKIPVLYGIDAIHGVSYTLGGTLFPQSINMAATFNRDLSFREGEITAAEMKASGIPWNFFPVMDVGRQPLWSRFWETYGEDVHLSRVLGRAYIEGHQGDDYNAPTKGATCLKHYAGYSFPFSGRDRTMAWISERMMREYFLPGFEEGVRAGSPTVMVNSAEVDGIPGHANHHLITEVLKGEMGFEGFVVSDWEDIKRLFTRDKVAASPLDAVRIAVLAGVDMSMVPLDYSFCTLLIQCVQEGLVPIRRVDDAVSRILRIKFAMGIFDQPYPDASLKKHFALPGSTAVNRAAAEESIVLAKNSGILPLPSTTRLLVTGPTAHLRQALSGGWTVTWLGDQEHLLPADKPTVLEALQKTFGEDRVTYHPGTTLDAPVDIPAAVNAATQADAVVVCLGEKAYCESPGNIDHLMLEQAQLDLAAAMEATGKPVILVLLEGRPRVIEPVVEGAAAVLVAFRPGNEGAGAIARILTGDVNPSARLPFTYPRYPNALMCYDYKPVDVGEFNRYYPQWPFGHGLSYTTFAYSDLRLSQPVLPRDGSVQVSVTVRNTGARSGAESVLLFVHDHAASVSRPNRQLKGFKKVVLNPGEERTVQFPLSAADLSFIGIEHTRVVEPGEFSVFVGPLTAQGVLE